MSAAAGVGGTSLPPIRDIIGALRKAAAAIVKVAGVVDRMGSAAPIGPGQKLGMKSEILEAVQELQAAVNQLATDELEDDLRTEQLRRELDLHAETIGALGAEMRGLRELPRQAAELRAELANVVHQLRDQNRTIEAQTRRIAEMGGSVRNGTAGL